MYAFDIGANRGDYSVRLVNIGYDKILAVEANKELCDLARKTVEGLDVTVLNVAVGEEEGIGRFYSCNISTLSTMSDD